MGLGCVARSSVDCELAGLAGEVGEVWMLLVFFSCCFSSYLWLVRASGL